MSNWRFH